MKNYICVEDKYFKVTLVNGKPVMEEVKAEEAIDYEVEAVMISEDEGIDRSMFQDIIDVTQKDMKENLEKSLKQIILGIMGLSGGDRGYYVSGFNDNQSPVAHAIAKKLEKRLQEVDLDRDLDLTPGEKTKLRALMKKSFNESYRRQMQQLAWREGEKLAGEHCKEVVKDLMGDKLKEVAKGLLNQAIREKSRPR